MNLEKFILENSEPNEIWKDVPNYEDLYMISSHGRIIAKEKLVNNRFQDVIKPIRFLKINECEGRKSIHLYKNGKSKKFSISQLVALVFLPAPEENCLLKFKDKNSLNCHVDNLVWVPKIDRHARYNIEVIEDEIWKNIPEYENLYMVSNKGRVKSLGREIQTSNRVIKTQDRILAQTPNVGGYPYVSLTKNKKSKKFLVHRLVALVFIENPNNYPQVDHIDTNTCNNCAENLRWVTPALNMKNETTQKHLSESRKGKQNQSWNCVPIVQLRNNILINTYPSIAEAERAGFCYSSIQRCLYGTYKSHKGYEWKYLSDYQKLTPESVTVIPSPEVIP